MRTDVLSALGRAFVEEFLDEQRKAVGKAGAEAGAVTFVQRFGGSLCLDVHFHLIGRRRDLRPRRQRDHRPPRRAAARRPADRDLTEARPGAPSSTAPTRSTSSSARPAKWPPTISECAAPAPRGSTLTCCSALCLASPGVASPSTWIARPRSPSSPAIVSFTCAGAPVSRSLTCSVAVSIYGRVVRVDARVLIPRPETELPRAGSCSRRRSSISHGTGLRHDLARPRALFTWVGSWRRNSGTPQRWHPKPWRPSRTS